MAAVVDADSRRVIGWAIAGHTRYDLVQDAHTMGIVLRTDRPATVTFRSDCGQCASAQIAEFAAAHGITRSLEGSGI